MLSFRNIHFKSIFTLGLRVFYPFLILFIFGWFLIPYTKEYLKEIIAFGLLSGVCFSIILLIPNIKFRKWFLVFFTIILSILVLIKLSFYYNYGVKLSASALFVIFETNAVEASDFLSNYFNSFTLVVFFLLLIPFILYFVKSLQNILQESLQENLKFSLLKIVAILLIPISLYLIQLKFQDKNLALTSYYSYEDFLITKNLLKKNLAQKSSTIIKVDSFNTKPQTHVVIIGESTSKLHMQLYGYSRETNPLLTEIKDELIVFKDVITPHVHTINALEKILTLSNFKDPKKKENASIVQLANQADYTTYWLSNQRPVGLHESTASLISGGANHRYFLTSDDYMFNIYDENILPKLDAVLAEKEEKKIIFIHLIGTHSGYDNRYPDEYDFFSGIRENQKFTHDRAIELTNTYDNAVRYNDFIVREIIEKIRRLNTSSYVMYFSDHGDDIFDVYEDVAGHNSYHGTAPMYEIPFVVWTSKSFKKNHSGFNNLKKNQFKKYNLEHFIHSFSEISDIQFNLFQPTNSIFNSQFKVTKRLIKQGRDYDEK